MGYVDLRIALVSMNPTGVALYVNLDSSLKTTSVSLTIAPVTSQTWSARLAILVSDSPVRPACLKTVKYKTSSLAENAYLDSYLIKDCVQPISLNVSLLTIKVLFASPVLQDLSSLLSAYASSMTNFVPTLLSLTVAVLLVYPLTVSTQIHSSVSISFV